MKQSMVLFIFALLCLYKSSIAGGAAGYSGDADDAYLDSITCGVDGEATGFAINIPDINRWDMDDVLDWELQSDAPGRGGSDCQPTSFSGTVQYGPFNNDQCAKEITREGNFIKAVFEVNVDTSGGDVTFQYDHHYLITCWYSRIDDTLEASFLPLHSVNSDGSGYGSLTFDFVLYFSNGNEVGDQVIDLESELYGVLTVDGAGFPGLDVHFEALTATSSEGSWSLISDGCSDDSTIITDLTCDDDDDEEVDFLAFRFEGQSGNSLVTFEVTAIVCLQDDAGNVCDTDCLTCAFSSDGRRKRRSLDVERTLQTKYYLKAGPYEFGHVDKENQKDADDVDEGDSSTFPTYLIAILVVSGVVAIAIVSAAVIIVLRKRRRNATLAESSGNSESGTGPV